MITSSGISILSRYLPPLPAGIAANWIASRSLSGRFILDPFGASPDLIVEAARNGARLIVAANNPITRALIESAAHPPSAMDTRNILASLAAARIRDERLEIHIKALYSTRCPNCQADIQAEAFLWEREAKTPFARLIHCPECGVAGEYPITEADQQLAGRFTAGGLHHARALERVAPLHDPDRVHAEEALSVYPPKAVYALLTIVNKLDTLNLQPKQEKILAAMLLNAFDRANTLWPHPVARERPRQLTIPPVFRENNLWLALENTIDTWPGSGLPVNITQWPNLPGSEGGVCLFEGRIRDLAERLDEIELSGVLIAFPRPNQAYWTLSALWAGWLWGPAAVDHFKSVLRRRRYDWAWHTAAVQAALESLHPVLPQGLPLLGVIGEAEPGFISAVLIAATQAGFKMSDINLIAGEKLLQIHWQAGGLLEPVENTQALTNVIRTAAREYLLELGEPCSYLPLHSAILSKLAQQNLFPPAETPFERYNQTQQAIQATLDFRHGFLRFGSSEKSMEVGQWWLADAEKAAIPLSDRAEKAVASYLIQNPGCSLAEVEAAIRQEFSGLHRPSTDLVIECLESYGDNVEVGWLLREMDAPQKRRKELESMVSLISDLGGRLGFRIQSPEDETGPCLWLGPNDQPKYAFYLSVSAILGKYLVEQNPPPARGLIVIPGGRSNLVMFKLQHNPHFRQIAEQNWQFVKFRQIRQLADSPILTIENMESQLGLDPLTYKETQLRMF